MAGESSARSKDRIVQTMNITTDSITTEDDFLRAVERNAGAINKVCYYYAHDAEEFTDLRQDVLANLWAYRSTFRGDSALFTWIYRISLNTCISALRRRKRRGQRVGIEAISELMADDTDKARMHTEMHALIGRLSAEQKAIVLLWIDEMSYDEIAAIVGCPRNTVASRLRRIKEKLARWADE